MEEIRITRTATGGPGREQYIVGKRERRKCDEDKKDVREHKRGTRAVYPDRDEHYQKAHIASMLKTH